MQPATHLDAMQVHIDDRPLAVPSDGWLHVIGLVHACEEAEVVEDGHELVCLVVREPVAPPVLDERELRVDAHRGARRTEGL